MLEAVLFDLDHTLYDRDATLTQLTGRFRAHFKPCFRTTVDANWLAAQLIEADRHNYRGWQHIYRLLETALPWDPPGFAAYESFMNANLGKCAMPYPETKEVLHWCREQGLKLGMVTNGIQGLQNDKIDALGIRQYFNVIVISGEFGAHKPDPSIFRHAAELLGLQPQSIAFVGDNPVNDILASAAMGMVPIWLDHFAEWPEGVERPEYVAHGLGEVTGILSTLGK